MFQRIIAYLTGQRKQISLRHIGRRVNPLSFEALERRAMLTSLSFSDDWEDDERDDDEYEHAYSYRREYEDHEDAYYESRRFDEPLEYDDDHWYGSVASRAYYEFEDDDLERESDDHDIDRPLTSTALPSFGSPQTVQSVTTPLPAAVVNVSAPPIGSSGLNADVIEDIFESPGQGFSLRDPIIPTILADNSPADATPAGAAGAPLRSDVSSGAIRPSFTVPSDDLVSALDGVSTPDSPPAQGGSSVTNRIVRVIFESSGSDNDRIENQALTAADGGGLPSRSAAPAPAEMSLADTHFSWSAAARGVLQLEHLALQHVRGLIDGLGWFPPGFGDTAEASNLTAESRGERQAEADGLGREHFVDVAALFRGTADESWSTPDVSDPEEDESSADDSEVPVSEALFAQLDLLWSIAWDALVADSPVENASGEQSQLPEEPTKTGTSGESESGGMIALDYANAAARQAEKNRAPEVPQESATAVVPAKIVRTIGPVARYQAFELAAPAIEPGSDDAARTEDARRDTPPGNAKPAADNARA